MGPGSDLASLPFGSGPAGCCIAAGLAALGVQVHSTGVVHETTYLHASERRVLST